MHSYIFRHLTSDITFCNEITPTRLASLDYQTLRELLFIGIKLSTVVPCRL